MHTSVWLVYLSPRGICHKRMEFQDELKLLALVFGSPLPPLRTNGTLTADQTQKSRL